MIISKKTMIVKDFQKDVTSILKNKNYSLTIKNLWEKNKAPQRPKSVLNPLLKANKSIQFIFVDSDEKKNSFRLRNLQEKRNCWRWIR